MSKENGGPALSNRELADAIEYAFKCCDQRYVGGTETPKTKPGEEMLAHLRALLEVQRNRAERSKP